jgi:N-acetylglutamate synthase
MPQIDPMPARMGGTSEPAVPAFGKILAKGLGARLLGVLRSSDGAKPVACGMAAWDGLFVGLFDLVTAPEHRRNGFGTQLVCSMLEWARGKGAQEAYLQVVSTNVPAVRLYTKLGFQPAYEYFYLVQGDGVA